MNPKSIAAPFAAFLLSVMMCGCGSHSAATSATSNTAATAANASTTVSSDPKAIAVQKSLDAAPTEFVAQNTGLCPVTSNDDAANELKQLRSMPEVKLQPNPADDALNKTYHHTTTHCMFIKWTGPDVTTDDGVFANLHVGRWIVDNVTDPDTNNIAHFTAHLVPSKLGADLIASGVPITSPPMPRTLKPLTASITDGTAELHRDGNNQWASKGAEL